MSDLSAALRMEPPEASATRPGHRHMPTVLHLVGRITDTVFSFLGPTTKTLAEQGIGQVVVLMDDPRNRHHLARIDPSVQLVLVDGELPFRERHAALLKAYCRATRVTRPSAAHLHGVLCLMLGLYASRRQSLSVPTFFTPHGSRTLAPLRLLWTLLTKLLQPAKAGRGYRIIIASSGAEARRMKGMTSNAVHLVEGSVSPAFFNHVRAPSPAPRIVTGQRAENDLGTKLFAQCAVLLVDQMPGLHFTWIGTADGESAARMKAAGITVVDYSDEEIRAHHMASAWIFLAPEGAPGFPVFLAEAMALGLACVAWDTPAHRDLIAHGVTGLLCNNTDEALERLAELLASWPLRRRIGTAARAQARQRFAAEKFSAALLGVYGTAVER